MPNPKAPIAGTESGHAVLRLASNILALVCLSDCFLVCWGGGYFQSDSHIHDIYKVVLGIFLTRREGHLWSARRGDADAQETLESEFFVAAWIGLGVVMHYLGVLNYPVVWPPNYWPTFYTVLPMYCLGTLSGMWRGVKASRGWTGDLFGGGDSGGGDSGGGTDDGPDENTELAVQIAQYCRMTGQFTTQGVAERHNISVPRARGFIIQLIKQGLVEKLGHDHFRWIGK